MKINCRVNPTYTLVDAINSMSWISAAISITSAGLLALWAIGGFFIAISI